MLPPRVEELPAFPEVQVPKNARPTVNGKKQLDGKKTGPMFAVYVWFQYEGRQLTREETLLILRKFVFDKDYTVPYITLDHFEDTKHALYTAYQSLDLPVKVFWKGIVGMWFSWILQFSSNKTRAEGLMG